MINTVLGLLLIWLVFYDVFNSIVLPRQSSKRLRLSPILVGKVAWIPYRNLAAKLKNNDAREDILGNYGALAFFLLVLLWLSLLVTGYASIFWGLRQELHPALQNFSEAMYFAGTSILTIGFGDLVPLTLAARLAALMAGVSGLALLGLCFSFVFNLQNFLYQREVPLAVMFSRLEGNFSGLNILLQYSHNGTIEHLRSDVREWEKWLGTIMESHRDFPLLCFFRSTGRGESWITCLGSLLDMCNILTTCVEGYDFGECRFFHRLGAGAAQMLCHYLDLPINVCELISQEEFTLGYEQLQSAGYKLKDQQLAWQDFSPSRCEYAPYISALCIYYAAKEPRWLCPEMPMRDGNTP